MGGGYRHSDQSAEAADAVVDVDDIVADFELLDFLQRQRHLTGTRLVALEVVLVETVEYLVVGQQAGTGIVVDEAFV